MARGDRGLIALAAVLGAAAVALGAIGSHALDLDADGSRRFVIANRYHFYHVLALLMVALTSDVVAVLPRRLAAICWCAGMLLFCGSLYLMAITGYALAPYLAPSGGLLLIAGWVSFALAAWRGSG